MAAVIASVILNDMERSDFAAHGFRSWMLQQVSHPYEVVINLFNDQADRFRELAKNRNPLCDAVIKVFPRPAFFNISAANNLGLHVASGEYVLFCNSDVIFPSCYLATAVEEMTRHGVSYADAWRVNLGPTPTKALAPPLSYDGTTNYDFLVERESQTPAGGVCAWLARREVARAIGGFDPRVLCHEDKDFEARILHYLSRNGAQRIVCTLKGLRGFHLFHEASELYNLSRAAKAIVEPRRYRLLVDPASSEDVVPTQLGSLQALLSDLAEGRPPHWSIGSALRSAKGLRWARNAYRRGWAAVRAFRSPV